MMHRAFKDIRLTTLPRGLTRRPEATELLIRTVLDSEPMRGLRFVLSRRRLRVEPKPIVCKDLTESLVRLMFPVAGGSIVDGAVVSIVCLFDRKANRTLYAHPMHAGPGVNPLVRHQDGPMASPKPQSDRDGIRANRRIIEHKKALWDRFLRERPTMGPNQAGRRWRDGYYWSLQRLYFCAGCNHCKWGSPFFDGPDGSLPRKAAVVTDFAPSVELRGEHRAIVSDVVSSEAWCIEARYAQRGGFTIARSPLLIRELDDDFVEAVFPTNVRLIQAGSLVAAAFTIHKPSRGVALSHCLAAGEESEIQFLKGDVAFGLPLPRRGTTAAHARTAYQSWRREGWSRFWLRELDDGLQAASAMWLGEFWTALADLFGGNDIPGSAAEQPGRRWFDHDSESSAVAGEPVLPAQALENTDGRCFSGHVTNHGPTKLRALGLSTLMVNVGHRCNQACGHCHIDAGPNRTEEMTRETVHDVLRAIERFHIETLDITGGAPELNPHFRHLAKQARRLGCRVVDRCNLTVFFEPGHEDLPEFLAAHRIDVHASLPSDDAKVADRQRGKGTFDKSIAALRRLNDLGYGHGATGLTLNLVYSPSDTDLGPPQDALQRQYKRELFERYGIVFDRLFVMNNMPIKRFEHYLKREKLWTTYTDRLAAEFHADTTGGLMCRRTLSVAYDGRLYDCDFNQVTSIPLIPGLPTHIRDLDAALLQSREIHTAGHCFGCTAGAGSSCNGALVGVSPPSPARHDRAEQRDTAPTNGVKV